MITTDSEFDPTKFKLGSICKRDHIWRGLNMTVRAVSNNACRVCMILLATKPKSERHRTNNLSPKEYLLARVVKNNTGCWIWQGTTVDKTRAENRRYGAWRCAKLPEKVAHRAAYRIFNGDLPDGSVVIHSCDTPLCCNPTHLLCGTVKENNRDRDTKGRHHPLIGSKHGTALINEHTARLIKRRLRELQYEPHRCAMIAKELNLRKHIVFHIKYNRTWKHVE